MSYNYKATPNLTGMALNYFFSEKYQPNFYSNSVKLHLPVLYFQAYLPDLQ